MSIDGVASPARAGLAIIAASTLLVAGVNYPAVASGPTVSNASVRDSVSGSQQAGQATDDWQSVDASVDERPKVLVADLGPKESAQVVAVRAEQGRPVFEAVEVRGQAAAKQVVRQHQADRDTVAVVVEQKRSFVSAASAATAGAVDTLRAEQWALGTLRADDAWAVSRGAGQSVAVLDTGVSPEDDLRANLLAGWDFVDDRADGRVDPSGHGTHIAGIIAAQQGNGLGTAGLAPDARILPVRVLDKQGMGYWSDIAQGIVYATDSGASVLNMSFSATQMNAAMQTAISYAASRGRILVAAAGNDGTAVAHYPAADPRVIAVGASTSGDTIAAFSNRGSHLELAAPGVGIWSTVPGSLRSDSGTSMATGFVSAAAALLRSAAVDRRLGAIDVATALGRSAVDIDQPGRDVRSGAGRIDPFAALCVIGACGSAATLKAKLTPTLSVNGKSLTVRLNRAAVHNVILKKRLTKRAAKKRYAKGQTRSVKRGKWRVDAVTASSDSGQVSFRLKKKFIYRIFVPATASSEFVKTAKVRRR